MPLIVIFPYAAREPALQNGCGLVHIKVRHPWPRSFKWSHSIRFLHEICICTYPLPILVSFPSHLILLYL